jgi:hypothetical protein
VKLGRSSYVKEYCTEKSYVGDPAELDDEAMNVQDKVRHIYTSISNSASACRRRTYMLYIIKLKNINVERLYATSKSLSRLQNAIAF